MSSISLQSIAPSDASDIRRSVGVERLLRVSGLQGVNGFSAETGNFTLFWKDGKREVVRGLHAADAMTAAGYGGGAIGALDFYAAGDCHDYAWDVVKRNWKMIIKQIEPVRLSQSDRRAHQHFHPELFFSRFKGSSVPVSNIMKSTPEGNQA